MDNGHFNFLHAKIMVKKFKHRFCIKELLIWTCKVMNADVDKYKYSGCGMIEEWEKCHYFWS